MLGSSRNTPTLAIRTLLMAFPWPRYGPSSTAASSPAIGRQPTVAPFYQLSRAVSGRKPDVGEPALLTTHTAFSVYRLVPRPTMRAAA